MVSGGVRITGLREKVKGLEAMGVSVDDLKGAFGKIAARGAEIAAGFAPVLTGALSGSIRGNKAKNRALVVAGKGSTPYAGAINYGWGARNIAPSHFMQRADTELKPYAETELNAELDRLSRQNGL